MNIIIFKIIINILSELLLLWVIIFRPFTLMHFKLSDQPSSSVSGTTWVTTTWTPRGGRTPPPLRSSTSSRETSSPPTPGEWCYSRAMAWHRRLSVSMHIFKPVTCSFSRTIERKLMLVFSQACLAQEREAKLAKNYWLVWGLAIFYRLFTILKFPSGPNIFLRHFLAWQSSRSIGTTQKTLRTCLPKQIPTRSGTFLLQKFDIVFIGQCRRYCKFKLFLDQLIQVKSVNVKLNHFFRTSCIICLSGKDTRKNVRTSINCPSALSIKMCWPPLISITIDEKILVCLKRFARWLASFLQMVSENSQSMDAPLKSAAPLQATSGLMETDWKQRWWWFSFFVLCDVNLSMGSSV